MDYNELFLGLRACLPLIGQGKVRDSFRVNHEDKNYRLVVASDRLSIFDFVLGFSVPQKGEVLNAMNLFNTELLVSNGVLCDVVASGPAIDEYIELPFVRGNAEVWKRAVLVEDLATIPVEAIHRYHLTGSGFRTYLRTLKENNDVNGVLCGHSLPPGLRDGERLPQRLYTPSTKAEAGHDEDMLASEAQQRYPGVKFLTGTSANVISAHAASVGLIFVDTKFEVGRRPTDGKLVMIDEKGTPDSSRFWDAAEYAACWPDRLPRPWDKEGPRTWGRERGIQALDPLDRGHREKVRRMQPAAGLIESTIADYRAVFERYTGVPLETFQRDTMGIK